MCERWLLSRCASRRAKPGSGGQWSFRLPGVGRWHNRRMRIHDDNGNKLDKVYVALTDIEARQLISYLQDLVETREYGWHEHLMEGAGLDPDTMFENELTVYRADAEGMVF